MARDDDDDAQPLMECPKCHELLEDFDGFGVIAHEVCGYCTHSCCDDGVCVICGEIVSEAAK